MNNSLTPPDQLISDYWESPVVDHQFLWLSRQLYTGLNNYFFFNNDDEGPSDPIYVLIIGARDTFKISDESDSSIRISNLLESMLPSQRQRGSSFKVWNSPLALEACLRIGMSSKEYNEMEKFQYIVLTQDETIEFVTLNEPRWETYEGKELDDLVLYYLKKDSWD
jgi:hypothetical protein